MATASDVSLENDERDAQRLGFVSTPVFLLGKVDHSQRLKVALALRGERTIEEFRKEIKLLLNSK